ncbi:hypothetical protein LMG29542_06253 [Paraburkholderia humisilvae]|uniref:Uncharacterized protein n=1 Tax=Paraburkholderia humisilvae TaxID=627669 RepID=A0A6J5EXC5_9BURK|nr:hypothetical protein LMG29542_06253 [Paraburkholderia humisilvae]
MEPVRVKRWSIAIHNETAPYLLDLRSLRLESCKAIHLLSYSKSEFNSARLISSLTVNIISYMKFRRGSERDSDSRRNERE